MRACRTCLTKRDLNPLFGDFSAVRFTSKQLYLATGIQIQPNDDLPQEACKTCIKKIQKSLDFRYISSKTNEYLQQILKKDKIKSETINNYVWDGDEDNFDKYFENLDLNKTFVDVKIEQDYLEHNDIDNNENISQFDNSHNNLDNKRSVNNHFDYHKNNDTNDNKNKLDNERNQNNYLDNDRNFHNEFDNSIKSHKNNLEKQYLYKKNTKKHITRAKRQNTKQITEKTIENTKLPDRKSKIQDISTDLSQKTDLKNKDYQTVSRKADISNNSSKNKQEKSMKIKDICDKNENNYEGIQSAMSEEAKINKMNKNKEINKLKRNKLMSLALTPHSSKGPVQCEVCHEHVKLASFVMHAKRHFTPEFTCEECGKMFLSHAHMSYHQQRMHGKEKRLVCSICDYRTVDRLKLKNHERSHTGERPFICNECGSSFRMRTNIVQHMRTHFGVRHVQCELCANMFRSKSELANHKNKVHNQITYLCYLCPQTYKGKRAVRRHLINLHGVKEDQILKIKYIKSKK